MRQMDWRVVTVAGVVFWGAGAAGKIICVDDDANSPGDGRTWATAYKYLQDALADANSSPKPVEVRVAQGVYRPNEGGGQAVKWSFSLMNGVAIRGGYAGVGAADPNLRDVSAFETALSGDTEENDWQFSYPPDFQYFLENPELFNRPSIRRDNCCHVIMSVNTDGTAVLDGCTISGGTADCWYEGDGGGGLFNAGGSPTISNCRFCDNWAFSGAGGASIFSGQPVFAGCVFERNLTLGIGAALCGSAFMVTDCTFERNYARSSGGALVASGVANVINSRFADNCAGEVGGAVAVYNYCTIQMVGCDFRRNCAVRYDHDAHGGAIWAMEYSQVYLRNCLLAANVADGDGGGVRITWETDLHMENCTLAGNRAGRSGGGIHTGSQQAKIVNSILWGNEPDEIVGDSVSVAHSAVRGGWPGEGNVDHDPCFAEIGVWDANGTPDDAGDDFWADGDYHLRSQAGRWLADERRWAQDDVTSPCIDAGDPLSPIGLEPFPNGGRVNMGAYGGTGEASRSWFGGAVCETIVAGDINGDCRVDFKDVALLALHWSGGDGR